jgi:hypothetical protein
LISASVQVDRAMLLVESDIQSRPVGGEAGMKRNSGTSSGLLENPLTARAILGGTVILPCLKQSSETVTQWRVAPSGS